MSTAAPVQTQAATSLSVSHSTHAGLLLQRKCACGGSAGLTGDCEGCRTDKLLGANGARLQRKLAVGASNDPLEQEADRVADQVMAAPAHSAVSGAPPRIQRVTGQSTEGTDTAPASVDRVLAGSGRPLDPVLRQEMEQRFGYDFSRVRVHSSAAAEQSAREVNARAYTVGNNIVFGAGQFAPGSQAGRRLMAHELTHVVQQDGAGRSIEGARDTWTRGQNARPDPATASAQGSELAYPGRGAIPSVTVAPPGMLRRMNMYECARIGVPCPPAIGWPEICRLVYCTRSATANLPFAISPGVCVYQCSNEKICACVLVGNSVSAICSFRFCSGGVRNLADQGDMESFANQAVAAAGDQRTNAPPRDGGASGETPVMQAKLMVNITGDRYEREADRVADQVLSAAANPVVSGASPCIQRFTGQSSMKTDTVPASVDRVLASSGSPLEPALRQDMEQRFGHDFSRVRVHSGAAAEQSVADVGANAYTVGASIVFGADRYAPSSAQGRKLIAHELVHVVQQERHYHCGLQRDLALPTLPKYTAAQLTDKQIEDAIAFNGSLFRIPETLSLIRDVVGVARKPAQSDKPLALAVGKWQAMHGLAQDGRLDPATVASVAKELKAEQANLIRWASGGAPPVSTQPDPKAGAAALDAVPTATKQRVQVVTAAVPLERGVIDSIFVAPRQGAPQFTFSSGLNEIFGAGIPDNAKKGLGNLAGYLIKFDATKPDGSKTKALIPDSTITLEISLRPHLNLAGLFRFSRIANTSNTSAPDRLIIELIRELPPMHTKMLDLEPALTGNFTVGGVTFTAGVGWRQDTSALLRKSLTLLPSAALNAASRLTFVQAGAGSAAEAGNYNPDSDTVTIHDNAFKNSDVRAGESPAAVWIIAHEVGHALDLRPLQTALNTASAAGTAQAWAALPASRSLSGSRWQSLPGQNNNFERRGEKSATVDTGFRQAATADGFKVGTSARMSGGVTNDGNINWEEAFAEAFALYATDPARLKSLRPKTYEYFTKRYPRPASSTSPAGAGAGKP